MTFDDIQSSFNKSSEALSFAQKRYNKIKKLRDDKCPHDNLVPKLYYFSGSYYDTAYTDTWNECVVCGKKFDKKNEMHSWYG